MLQHISKSFGQERALHEINLAFAQERTTALIGPSGCGKSTLLRLINGLIRPDSGQILVEKKALNDEHVATWRHRIGYVIQKGGLFPHMNNADNVCILVKYLGWDRKKISDRLRQLLEMVHLEERMLHRFPSQLSGGQRQRVSLVRALMHDPDYLLLDEPLGAIDPMVRYELQKELKSIFSTLQKTVILVTHDLPEAAFLGDEMVLMNKGGIEQQGRPKELVEKPISDFAQRFVQSQSMHLS